MWFWFIFGAFPVYGRDGSWTNYVIDDIAPWGSPDPDYYLTIWNSTAVPTMLGADYGTSAWQWRPSGGAFGSGWPQPPGGYWIHDGNDGFSLNVSIPTSIVQGPRNSIVNQTAEILCVRESEYVIIGTEGQYNEDGTVQGKLVGLSLEPGSEGAKLWETMYTPPFASKLENITAGFFSSFGLEGVYPEDGVFTFYSPRELKRWGFSLDIGALLWESGPEVQMSYYGSDANYYEGKLYTYGYGGQIRCYDIKTGDVLWNYDATVEGLEIGYGGRYPIGICAIADGKLYTVCGEHSPTQPLWRAPYTCINATTGEEIWKLNGFRGTDWGGHSTIGDSVIVGPNTYDQRVYAVGKGPSAMTVTAAPDVSVHGSSVLVKGMVTDVSPGTEDSALTMRFPNGVPAVSDESMNEWMQHVYMQFPRPADATGVEVVLEVLDPNNNYYEVGRTTSDASGFFSCAFTPEVPGLYKIIATFAGSGAYYGSFAETAINVEEAPQPTPAPTPTPASVADMYFLPVSIGMIIAIVIVLALLVLMLLRKR